MVPLSTAAAQEADEIIDAAWKEKISLWKGSSAKAVSALDLYQLGQLLARLGTVQLDGGGRSLKSNLQSAVVGLVDALPDQRLFDELNAALLRVVFHEEDSGKDDAARENERLEALASTKALYHCLVTASDGEKVSSSTQSLIESCLAENGWLRQLVGQCRNEKVKLSPPCTTHLQELLAILSFETALHMAIPWETFLPVLHLLQEDDDMWGDLVEIQTDRHPGWQHQLASGRYPDHADYLESLLNLSQGERVPILQAEEPTPQQQAKPAAVVSAQDAIQHRIEQVEAVLPDFGQGFLEAALAMFGGNVQQTTAVLLDAPETWPSALQVVDRNLPRRKQAASERVDDDAQARQVTKMAVQAADSKAEQDALAIQTVLRDGAHDEYNDDYDDQYDGMADDVGGADEGLYDSVRTYNRLLKQVEQDQQFWQENRNVNHEQNSKKKEKNFGPDKVRGGRIPNQGGRGGGGRGRGRGGAGRGRGETETASGPAAASEEDKKKGNQRAKNRKLANRRDQQKKAAVKKTG